MGKVRNKIGAVITDLRAFRGNIYSIYPSRNEIEEYVRKHRRRFDLSSFDKKVSIIILNRNKRDYLTKCIDALVANTQYRNYEIIVIDNNSTDDSLSYLDRLDLPFMQVIKNSTNESFSLANNKAADVASGDYLVFLNNDTEPLNGWLEEMLLSMESEKDIGIVGSKLIYPKKESIFGWIRRVELPPNSVQHAGIKFSFKESITPFNFGKFVSPFSEEVNVQKDFWAVTAACMLVKKSVFVEVGGFDTQYVYGMEDVDLCLKVKRKGLRVMYCPYSTLYHYEFGTQKDDVPDEVKERRARNLRLFNDKWREYLVRELG